MTRNSPAKATLLVADDDATIRSNLAILLRSEGYHVLEAPDGEKAAEILAQRTVSLALLDLKMPGRTGLELLREFEDQLDDLPVIVITAFGGSQAAIEAMKLGAFDYISKPFDLDEVLFTVRRALKQQSLVAQLRSLELRSPMAEPQADEEFIGRTPAMLQVFKSIGRLANTHEAVLILGESGTGKELVANAIHKNSNRAGRPFIKVNCAALSSTLLESELFGHERGAFTGAVAQRIGRFEQANQGTLFLDEIGDLDFDLQAKLLRVLQTRQFERVGGNETITVDVRVISATHQDLSTMVADRRFREDLLYRLNVVSIVLPPLRERRDDIPLLAEHFVRSLARKYNWPHLALSAEACDVLSAQRWPGNVRELQNVLARAATLTQGKAIFPDDIQFVPNSPQTPPGERCQPPHEPLSLRDLLQETERRAIRTALDQSEWNRTKAASLLGISRRQLFDKIRQYGLEPHSDR